MPADYVAKWKAGKAKFDEAAKKWKADLKQRAEQAKADVKAAKAELKEAKAELKEAQANPKVTVKALALRENNVAAAEQTISVAESLVVQCKERLDAFVDRPTLGIEPSLKTLDASLEEVSTLVKTANGTKDAGAKEKLVKKTNAAMKKGRDALRELRDGIAKLKTYGQTPFVSRELGPAARALVEVVENIQLDVEGRVLSTFRA